MDDRDTDDGELVLPRSDESATLAVDSHDGETADQPDAADEETATAPACDESAGSATPSSNKPTSSRSGVRLAVVFGLVSALALTVAGGWLGWRAYKSHDIQLQHNVFLQTGRQAALNLTTIDYEHAEADVQRILDSATGTFYDDFQRRSPAFVNVVQQARSKTEGTVTGARTRIRAR